MEQVKPANNDGTAPLAQDADAPALPDTAKRRLLGRLSRVAPGLIARFLARRYLCSSASLNMARIEARKETQFLPLGTDAGIVRHKAAREIAGTRVLLVHGHDGHMRQFARVIRALTRAGAQVDALVLPGHLHTEETPCSMAEIVGAIQRAVAEQVPYDTLIAHCVSANGVMFALDEGLQCERVVLISAPLDLQTLFRFGGVQYGVSGKCLDRFVQIVSEKGAPYLATRPWQALATGHVQAILAVHARHDYAAPVGDLLALPDVWPNAELCIFEEGGHNTILSHTPAISRICEFACQQKP